MCGLTGFWKTASGDPKQLSSIIDAMTSTIEHRGPDDSGAWVDASAGVALGFRRLAILDLSPLGHQPMKSHGERYWMIFNGEAYNFKELRAELEACGHSFRSGSDTEVILEGAEEWGVEKIISKLNGMFALAIWDQKEKCLTLARDHFGIKPMYYGWWKGSLVFGSELKAIRAFPGCRPEVDRGALTLYVRHGFMPGPWSIYKDIFKLQPGCMVTFHAPDERKEPTPYWSLKQVAEQGLANPFQGTMEQATDQLDELLQDVVARQMISDVPLGAFLSGGIDSSLVVSMMQARSTRPVKTFCIGFNEEGRDESPYAKEVAEHLGTDHTEMFVTHQDARDLIPRLPQIYDEPFADSSAIPTTLLSILTRQHVTVSLSGDGGDELFGGYPQHWRLPARVQQRAKVPAILRQPLALALAGASNSLGTSQRAEKFEMMSGFLECRNDSETITSFLRQWKHPEQLVAGGFLRPYILMNQDSWPQSTTIGNEMVFIDSVLGLPDCMLTKVDRASSSTGLEARVPLLDPRVATFAWQLPWEMKVLPSGSGKAILKSLLARYVPRQMFDRPKQGFGVPIANWLRGPLRDWCEHMIDEKRLQREGYFDPKRIRKQWDFVKNGDSDWEMSLWLILVFQAWNEEWLSKP